MIMNPKLRSAWKKSLLAVEAQMNVAPADTNFSCIRSILCIMDESVNRVSMKFMTAEAAVDTLCQINAHGAKDIVERANQPDKQDDLWNTVVFVVCTISDPETVTQLVLVTSARHICDYCEGKFRKECHVCKSCRTAKYCSDKCQNAGWAEHKKKCRHVCTGCLKTSDRPVDRCKCRITRYCSDDCQGNDWEKHKADCRKARGKK